MLDPFPHGPVDIFITVVSMICVGVCLFATRRNVTPAFILTAALFVHYTVLNADGDPRLYPAIDLATGILVCATCVRSEWRFQSLLWLAIIGAHALIQFEVWGWYVGGAAIKVIGLGSVLALAGGGPLTDYIRAWRLHFLDGGHIGITPGHYFASPKSDKDSPVDWLYRGNHRPF